MDCRDGAAEAESDENTLEGERKFHLEFGSIMHRWRACSTLKAFKNGKPYIAYLIETMSTENFFFLNARFKVQGNKVDSFLSFVGCYHFTFCRQTDNKQNEKKKERRMRMFPPLLQLLTHLFPRKRTNTICYGPRLT